MKRFLLFPLLAATAFAAPAGQAPDATPAAPNPLRLLSDSFASVFEKAAPSVVVIEATTPMGGQVSGLPGGLDFFFRGPNGSPHPMVPAPDGGGGDTPNVGSGFVFTGDGHILTNNHVVAGAVAIQVKLRDGRKFDAELVGADERSDLAVLKIEAPDLPVAELGDSDRVRVGEFAFAIGTPMELPYTFTFGVVSAKGRNLGLGGHYDEFIQTDTSINPGNSGGPLCDIEGRVVGINTLISGINRGVGFAIPINTAKGIAAQLMEKGRVSRPWLGITIAGLEEAKQLKDLFPGVERGVVVRGIEPGAPVQSSDLSPGDVITRVDGREVSLASDLQREILGKKIGQSVELEVWRKGRTLRLSVRTGEHPDKFLRASTRSRRDTGGETAKPGAKETVPSPGLELADATPEALEKMGIQRKGTGGVLVTSVAPYSAAAVAGLEAGDIITEAGGRPVAGRKDFEEALKMADGDRGILVLLERAGQKTFAILKP